MFRTFIQIKNLKLFFVLLFFTSFGYAGDSVNNGGGLAEQNFWLAYSQLEKTLAECLRSENCQIDVSDRAFVGSLLSSLVEEKKTKEQLRFLEDQSQTFFVQKNHVLTAKTAPQVGAVIWINRDLIYKTQSNGSIKAYTVTEALGLLTEQLLVHQNLTDDLHRSYIALIIQNFYEKNL